MSSKLGIAEKSAQVTINSLPNELVEMAASYLGTDSLKAFHGSSRHCRNGSTRAFEKAFFARRTVDISSISSLENLVKLSKLKQVGPKVRSLTVHFRCEDDSYPDPNSSNVLYDFQHSRRAEQDMVHSMNEASWMERTSKSHDFMLFHEAVRGLHGLECLHLFPCRSSSWEECAMTLNLHIFKVIISALEAGGISTIRTIWMDSSFDLLWDGNEWNDFYWEFMLPTPFMPFKFGNTLLSNLQSLSIKFHLMDHHNVASTCALLAALKRLKVLHLRFFRTFLTVPPHIRASTARTMLQSISLSHLTEIKLSSLLLDPDDLIEFIAKCQTSINKLDLDTLDILGRFSALLVFIRDHLFQQKSNGPRFSMTSCGIPTVGERYGKDRYCLFDSGTGSVVWNPDGSIRRDEDAQTIQSYTHWTAKHQSQDNVALLSDGSGYHTASGRKLVDSLTLTGNVKDQLDQWLARGLWY